jgi:hypothetical protein
MRYFIPVAWLLVFPAAMLLTKALEGRHGFLRAAALLGGAGIIVFNLLRGTALTYEMIHDSRYEAAAWLEANTSAGDIIEYFGPAQKLPPLPAHVKTRPATYYGGIYVPLRRDSAKAQEILHGWQERKPKFIILIPDLTSPPGTGYNFSCPPELCDAMLNDSMGFTRVASFKTRPIFPWFDLPQLDYPTVNPSINIFSLPSQADS